MKLLNATATQYIYFVAVDATDLKTRKEGLSGFTITHSRDGETAATYDSDNVTEVSSSLMSGVYKLLVDEGVTMGSGSATEEMVIHITHSSMAPVTRVIELFRSEWDRPAANHNVADSFGARSSSSSKVQLAYEFWKMRTDYHADVTAADSFGEALTDISVPNIADAVWNEDVSEHQAIGSFGQAGQNHIRLPSGMHRVVRTGVCGGTGNSTTIYLDSTASAVGDHYNDMKIIIYSGPGAAATTERNISDYIGSARKCIVATGTVTNTTSRFIVYEPVPFLDSVADAVWDELRGTRETGTFGKQVDARVMVMQTGAITASSIADDAKYELDASLLNRTTIATRASQTSFTLAAGSTDDDAYVGATVVITRPGASYTLKKAFGRVSAYDGDTLRVTLVADPGIFTITADDKIDIRLSGVNNIESEAAADAALVAINLDHLMKENAADTDITNQSVIAQMAATSGNWSGFDKTTDSLQAASENASLIRTTIATRASQTSFTLTAGSTDDDAYIDALAVITDATTAGQIGFARVSDYVGDTKTVTLSADPGFDHAVNDKVEIRLVGSVVTPPTPTEIYTHFTNGTNEDAFKASVSGLSTLDAGDVRTQADAALVAINLDHLMFEAVDDENDMTTEVANETVLCNIMSKTQDTSTYDHGLHSLEAGPAYALKNIGLDHLMAVTAEDTDIINGSVIAQIVASGTPANWSGFVNTTDSLQAIGENLENETDGLSALKTLIDEVKDETTLIVADTDELQSDGVPGLISGLNNISTSQVNAEVDAAILTYNLDHLMHTAVDDNGDMTPEVVDGSVLSNIMSATSNTSTYVVADDSLEAIRVEGDDSWTTGAGGSSPTAADIFDHFTDAAQLTEFKAHVATALADIHLDHLLSLEYTGQGHAESLLGDLTESDGGTYRFTSNALEEAPSGTGASAATIATAVWDRATDGHTTDGTFGEQVIVADALEDINLNHLMKEAALDADITTNSVIGQLAATNGNFANFNKDEDSLQSIKDNAAWNTATGFNTTTPPTVAAIRSEIETASGSMLASIDTIADKLDSALEADGAGDWQFTGLGLENAPSGTGASAATIATEVWDRGVGGHLDNGSFGAMAHGGIVRQAGTRGVLRSGSAQGGDATHITLDAGASAEDGFYKGMDLVITAGTGVHDDLVRITAYVGSTRIASVADWPGADPDSTAEFQILYPPVPTRQSLGVLYAATATKYDTTHFDLINGLHSIADDAYNDCIAVFTKLTDQSHTEVRRIIDYNASSRRLTLDAALPTTIDTGDYLTILPALPLSKIGNAVITGNALDATAVDKIVEGFAAHRGTATAGATGSITLVSTASTTANIFKGAVITLVGGTGAGQSRRITGYSVERVADIEPPWTTNPTSSSEYVITGDGRPVLRTTDQTTLDGIATTLGTAGAGLTDLGGMSAEMKGAILIEALKVLQATSMTEPSAGVPAAEPNLDDAIMYLYGALRNKLTVTEDFKTLHNSSDVALYKKPLGDDGTTFTESESTTV